jgi:hypothetical protein
MLQYPVAAFVDHLLSLPDAWSERWRASLGLSSTVLEMLVRVSIYVGIQGSGRRNVPYSPVVNEPDGGVWIGIMHNLYALYIYQTDVTCNYVCPASVTYSP